VEHVLAVISATRDCRGHASLDRASSLLRVDLILTPHHAVWAGFRPVF